MNSKVTAVTINPPFENESFAKLYKVTTEKKCSMTPPCCYLPLNNGEYFPPKPTRRWYSVCLPPNVVPVKTINQVLITWALPSQLKQYKVKPLDYIGWVVGHEGNGSIASNLKERKSGISVECGISDTGLEHNSTCALFSINITLSDEGLNNLQQVLLTVFQYIKVIQLSGPKRELYDEISKLEEIDFRFQEPEDPQELVKELCRNMQLYEPEYVLTGNKLLMQYNEQVIRDCVDRLTANTANIMVLANQFAHLTGLTTEKWFGTLYQSEEIPQDLLVNWSTPAVNKNLFLPAANPLIGYASFYFLSASSNDSARNQCMADLFVQLLIHDLSKVTYDAMIAQISYAIEVDDCGVLLKFGGFNDKLEVLFHLVIDDIKHFDATDKQFDVVKRDLETVYLNQMMEPEKLNGDIRLSLLQHTHWTMAEKYAELASVDCASLLQFVKDFFSSVYVEGLVQGNITVEDAKSLEHYLLTKFNIKPESPTINSQIMVRQLPSSSAVVFRTKNPNEGDGNCVITNYYQHGPGDIEECLKMELLMVYMEEPCFNYLRTRQQLGYNVGSEISVIEGILGYTITICGQSSKHRIEQLDEEIELFLVSLSKRVAEMTKKEFNKLVSSVVETKRIEYKSLSDEVDINWVEIVNRTYLFDRRQQEIKSLRKLSFEEFKSWSALHLLASDQRTKISIQVTGNKPCTGTLEENDAVLATHSVIYMDDVEKFRNQFAVCYSSSKVL